MLTFDEETKLLDALHPRFQRFVRFALGTGCRLDEIRGIEAKENIDWIRGTVHVIGKFRKERDVPMQPDASAALKEQLEEEDKLWKQNPQRLREVLAEGAVRAKIPPITPHALRHTFGTRWLQAGGDIYKLSKILGHSSVAVTEAHYAHLLKEDLVAASQQVRIPVAPRGPGRKCRADVGSSSRPSMTGEELPGLPHRRLSPLVFINRHISRFFEYTWGMRKTLDGYLDERLGRGRGYLTKAEAMKTLGLSSTAFAAAAARLTRQRRLATPKQGFYLILRPEDRAAGGPDPARWIEPLMQHLGLDYRISLLRAAAFHGASHQAAQVFQVIVPKQLRPIAIDRQRIQFVYQAPDAFVAVNKAPWLGQLKTDAGLAKVAGVELLLLDVVRYFRQSAGLNGAAQIVHDLGAKADPRKLARAATFYENSTARRLGYLLEHFRHTRQAVSLRPLAVKAKSFKPLDPSVRIVASLARTKAPDAPAWKLSLNVPLEIDA